MDLFWILTILFIVVTLIFIAFAFFLPEWVGITGPTAKKFEADQRGPDQQTPEN